MGWSIAGINRTKEDTLQQFCSSLAFSPILHDALAIEMGWRDRLCVAIYALFNARVGVHIIFAQ